MPDGTRFPAPTFENLLADQQQGQFVRCLVEKMMILLARSGTEYYDKCAIDENHGDRADENLPVVAYVIAAIISKVKTVSKKRRLSRMTDDPPKDGFPDARFFAVSGPRCRCRLLHAMQPQRFSRRVVRPTPRCGWIFLYS